MQLLILSIGHSYREQNIFPIKKKKGFFRTRDQRRSRHLFWSVYFVGSPCREESLLLPPSSVADYHHHISRACGTSASSAGLVLAVALIASPGPGGPHPPPPTGARGSHAPARGGQIVSEPGEKMRVGPTGLLSGRGDPARAPPRPSKSGSRSTCVDAGASSTCEIRPFYLYLSSSIFSVFFFSL